jgi:hypothetical protein
MLVMLLVPGLNVLSFVIVHPVYLGLLQASVNELCGAREVNGPPPAAPRVI